MTAITRTQTSAADLALLEADLPCILAAHGFRDASSTSDSMCKWDDTAPAGPDQTLDGAPVARAYDGWAHHGCHTQPNAGAAAAGPDPDWSLLLEVGSADDLFEVDTVALFGSNLSEATALQVALWGDAGYAGSGFALTSEFAPGDQVRFLMLALTDASAGGPNTLYGNIYGAEVHFEGSSSFRPRVRELWLGKRIQLSIAPNRPYGHMREGTGIEEQVAFGGARTGDAQMLGRAQRILTFDLSELSHRTAVRRLWDESIGGTEAFLWIETPASAPTPFLMRLADTTYDPVLDAGDLPRTVTFELVEQAPLVSQDP